MDVLCQLLERDLRAHRSNLKRYARRLWERVDSRAHAGCADTSVKAVLYRFTGKKSLHAALPLWKTGVQPDAVASALCESILKRKEELARDPAWQAVLLAETEDGQTDALEAFFGACLEIFRLECLESWRNTRGTFAYYYRRAQGVLRENMKDGGWRLYDPRSRYYGPASLEAPRALDEQDPERLLRIPLPVMQDFEVRKLFYRDPLLTHAWWFYENLAAARADEEKLVVAIRNFVYWLCHKYALLDADEASHDALADSHAAQPEATPCAAPDIEALIDCLDIANLAKAAMARLDERERQILWLKMQRRTMEDIAASLGLSGPSHVSYYWSKLCKKLKAARLESPAMCGARDEESPADLNLPQEMEEAFTAFFVKLYTDES